MICTKYKLKFTFVRIAFIAIACFGIVAPLPAQRNSLQFRIGVIEPVTEGTGAPARQQDLGFDAARKWAKEAFPNLDVVVLQSCADASNPKKTLECAKQLHEDGVVAILGSINSICTLELPNFSTEFQVPIISAISTATRITKIRQGQQPWFFRAALADRYQMEGLAEWLESRIKLKAQNVAVFYEDTNENVQYSSYEDVRRSGRDVYGWGLREDFLEAPVWKTHGSQPIAITFKRGLGNDKDKLSKIESMFKELQARRGNYPIKAIGLLALWDDSLELAKFINKRANRERIKTWTGLDSNQELILFAGSGATLVDFYRGGGESTVGTYLLCPFFPSESSPRWSNFKKILERQDVDFSRDPDPYLALGFDAMSMLLSCLAEISPGNMFGQYDIATLQGQRAALRECLCSDRRNKQPSITGLTGYNTTGEAIRDLDTSFFILRVDGNNRLQLWDFNPPEQGTVEPSSLWALDLGKVIWGTVGLLLGATLMYLLVIRRYKDKKKRLSDSDKGLQAINRGNELSEPIIEAAFTEGEAIPKGVIPERAEWFQRSIFFGSDKESQKALHIIKQAFANDTNVPILILGPTGTGKTSLAKLIHDNTRPDAEFVEFKCGSVPDQILANELFGHNKGAFTGADKDQPGLFEKANGGTIFFDEIGNLSLDAQMQVLNSIDEKKVKRLGDAERRQVNTRVIAATNEKPEQRIQTGEFRADLLERLKRGLVITLPPLKDHRWDIPIYVQGFIELLRGGTSVSTEVLDIFIKVPWPGNYRELGSFETDGEPVGVLGILAKSSPGGILTAEDLWNPSLPSKLHQELRKRHIEEPDERNEVLSSSIINRFHTCTVSGRRWEIVLDTIFNKLRGPNNESFLLPTKSLESLLISVDELTTALGFSDSSGMLDDIEKSHVLSLPDEIISQRNHDEISARYRRSLVLFVKRSQFLGLRHEQLTKIAGLKSRQKLYGILRYVWLMEQQTNYSSVIPPASRYLMDFQVQGDKKHSITRPDFLDPIKQIVRERKLEEESWLVRLRQLNVAPGVGRRKGKNPNLRE